MWKNRKIPYAYHWSIDFLPHRRKLVESAIRDIQNDSCLQFENINDFMIDYMKNYTAQRSSSKFFELRYPPTEYPDYL